MSQFIHFGIAGAGFSGAVVARELAQAGHRVTVFDIRPHAAGNCHTERHADTGVLVHTYGPHIFHTPHQEVWEYVNRYAQFRPYHHRVKATARGAVYGLPINLHTINQLFGKTLSPAQAQEFVAGLADPGIVEPVSFEDQALRFVGRELYEAFFSGYTRKQWGIAPDALPASILKRLPLRFNYDDGYFNHPFQGMPEQGYTLLVERILDHPNIEVQLGRSISRVELGAFDHALWSGSIDSYFDHISGRLGYRTLDFQTEVHSGDYQGCAVMNYCDGDIPYTRITEHKHFAPWESHDDTVIYREFSRACGADDIAYYPIRLVNEKVQLRDYIELAKQQTRVSFLGRLGTYRYLDMDVTIKEALAAAKATIAQHEAKQPIPAFFVDPVGG